MRTACPRVSMRNLELFRSSCLRLKGGLLVALLSSRDDRERQGDRRGGIFAQRLLHGRAFVGREVGLGGEVALMREPVVGQGGKT